MSKNKKALMITLGHNSSALFYDGINKPVGYEEERLTRVKSDSSFPYKSIENILKNTSTDSFRGATIFVSHWFDTFNPEEFPEKYYDSFYVKNLSSKYDMEVVLLSKNFTHHDAHAYSSISFLLEAGVENLKPLENYSFIVADGFGNNQEVFSIYDFDKKSGELVKNMKFYGYSKSLGLLYQYACSYCGMKENQDEYKFLGYEANILEHISQNDLDVLEQMALAYVDDYLLKHKEYFVEPQRLSNHHINVEELKSTKEMFHLLFDSVMAVMSKTVKNVDSSKREIIGYYIQYIVENIVTSLVNYLRIENLALSGGCFYNVKLNNAIRKSIKGDLSIIPLAGDQGAAIGMYEKYIGGFRFYDLCYGVRDLALGDQAELPDRVFYFEDEEEMLSKVDTLLDKDYIVNIVHSEMEFGPRALCNTSTLAIPTKENVEYINKLNDRNTVMPMAPVVLEANYRALFSTSLVDTRVLKSHEFMIITDDFNRDAVESPNYRGVMHKYPTENLYSGRPQVVKKFSETVIEAILKMSKKLCLINTSFNTHGNPIVFSSENALEDFKRQLLKDDQQRNYLIIYNGN